MKEHFIGGLWGAVKGNGVLLSKKQLSLIMFFVIIHPWFEAVRLEFHQMNDHDFDGFYSRETGLQDNNLFINGESLVYQPEKS